MSADPRGRPRGQDFRDLLRNSVAQVVRDQADAGIDIVCDGEFGKISWLSYTSDRLSGFEPTEGAMDSRRHGGQDRRDFKTFYDSRASDYYSPPGKMTVWRCTGPVRYVGQDPLREDIEGLKSAMRGADVAEGFMPSTAPGSIVWENAFYASEIDYLAALSDALGEEYRTIVESGLILQIDDPALPLLWDRMLPDVDERRYQEACEVRIEAVNRALEGIPRERVRYHICWGSWHGPHSTDVPLEFVLPLLQRLKVGAWAFEAANVRHEHEWTVWQQLPKDDDRILIPGVVSHATDVLEHPRLVAQRLLRFADIVGPHRVIAGTDCGLGYRVHPQIAIAKLRMLSEGAALASGRLG